MPNTFNAKVGSENVLSAIASGNASQLTRIVLHGPLINGVVYVLRLLATNAILCPFVIVGLGRLWRRAPDGTGANRNRESSLDSRRSRVVPAALVLCPLAMSVVEPGAMLPYRYVTHLLVLYCCIGAIGFVAAWSMLVDPRRMSFRAAKWVSRSVWALGALLAMSALAKPWWWTSARAFILSWERSVSATNYVRSLDGLAQPILLLSSLTLFALGVMLGRGKVRAFMVTVLVLCVLSQIGMAWTAARSYALQVKNINALHIAAGEWIDRNEPHDVVVALDDIGGITYMSRRRMIDMIGLVTPEAISFRRMGKTRYDFLAATQPDLVATINPGSLMERPEQFRILHVESLVENVASVGDSLIVFETPWSRSRKQER